MVWWKFTNVYGEHVSIIRQYIRLNVGTLLTKLHGVTYQRRVNFT